MQCLGVVRRDRHLRGGAVESVVGRGGYWALVKLGTQNKRMHSTILSKHDAQKMGVFFSVF